MMAIPLYGLSYDVRRTLESGGNIAVPVTFISVAVLFFNIGIEQNLNAQQLSEVLCDHMEGKVCQFLNE